MRKVTWRRFDQSAKQLVVGQTTTHHFNTQRWICENADSKHYIYVLLSSVETLSVWMQYVPLSLLLLKHIIFHCSMPFHQTTSSIDITCTQHTADDSCSIKQWHCILASSDYNKLTMEYITLTISSWTTFILYTHIHYITKAQVSC